MNKNEFRNSTLAMIDNNRFLVTELLDKAIASGCLDIEGQDPENYATRKALIHCIFKSIAEQWKPLTTEGRKEANNISNFI